MVNKPTPLIDVLRALIAGTASQPIILRRGLRLRYHPPGPGHYQHRLFAYRPNIFPSDHELDTLRRALEQVIGRPALPAQRHVHGHLQGYILPWEPDQAPTQRPLPVEMPASTTYGEA